MSELANELLDAIASGNQEHMNAKFNDIMNSKINDTLQARKIELAQQIYNGVQAQSDTDEADQVDNADEVQTEVETATSDGTEEA